MSSPFPASAGIALRHGSHYYLLHRNTKARHWPNYWGFPGGKVEDGESPFSTAKRELLEETGAHVELSDIAKEIHVMSEYIDGKREYTLFLCNTWIGSPDNLEADLHAGGGWFSRDDFPEPMIPHIRKAFFAMEAGETEITYDGRGDIFE